MPRRPSAPRARAAAKPRRTIRAAKQTAQPSTTAPFSDAHNDQIVHLCDLCTTAQKIAEGQGEKFLAYLLSMAILEGQSALRRRIVAKAGVSEVVPDAKPSP